MCVLVAIGGLMLVGIAAAAVGGSGDKPSASPTAGTVDPGTTDEPPAATADATPANAVANIPDSVTVVLAGGRKIHIAQVDGPHDSTDCYGAASRAALAELLPVGTLITTTPEPKLKSVDRNGRRVAYVFNGSTNVALTLVKQGAVAPYFLDGHLGRYATQLMNAARQARAAHRGLWGACAATRLYPFARVQTKRALPGTKVTEVIDGDTIVVATGAHVRLVQIDSPEVTSGECYASQAKAALATLIPVGTRVILKGDPGLDQTDRYGRQLRYVFRGGENLNLTLVRRGDAAPYFYNGDHGQYAGQLYSAALAARRAKRGLWSACPATQLRPTEALATVAAAPPPSGGGSGSGGGSSGSGSGGAGAGCTDGYSPCLPDHGGADYDCGGGSGNGPYYTAIGVTYTVTGYDPYGLDADGDGLGCE